MSDFEAELIHHAAPTLLGRKQSNLFSLPLSLLPKCREEIALYGKKLAEKGICIVYLYSFKNRVFIMVYRQNAMMRYLRVPHVRDYLISLGYPARIGKKDAMTETLAHLRKRMQADGDFPHEIGFFLGIPLLTYLLSCVKKVRITNALDFGRSTVMKNEHCVFSSVIVTAVTR